MKNNAEIERSLLHMKMNKLSTTNSASGIVMLMLALSDESVTDYLHLNLETTVQPLPSAWEYRNLSQMTLPEGEI